jgi:hypothetical protein
MLTTLPCRHSCMHSGNIFDIEVMMQFAMVRELFRLAQKAQQEYAIEAEQRQGRRGLRKAKLGSSQQWYFFGVAAFWMYLR